MYIQTQTYKRKDGQKRVQYYLYENHRVDGKSKRFSLLPLGPDFRVSQSKWKKLLDGVQHKLGLEVGLPFEELDPDIEREADRIATALKERGYTGPDQTRLYMRIKRQGGVRHPAGGTTSVGGARVAKQALDELKLEKILIHAGVSGKRARVICALVAARMLAPGSERSTQAWIPRSALMEVMDLQGIPLSVNTLYRASDEVWAHRDVIMDELYEQQQTRFSHDRTIRFFDLTHTYSQGSTENELLQHGRGKDGKKKRLVTLALVIDAWGLPVKCGIYPGNVAEVKTLREVLEGFQEDKPTLIMDAGLVSQANLRWMRENGFDYVCNSRKRTEGPPDRAPEARLETAGGREVLAWELERSGDERLIHVRSSGRKVTEDRILCSHRDRFEAQLHRLHTGLGKKGCRTRYDKVHQYLGALKARHRTVARHYDIQVTPDSTYTNATSVTWTRTAEYPLADGLSGGYVLRTTRPDWDQPEVLAHYWQLADIENTFRTLKSELGLRPFHHRLRDRICAHLFITVLAYHMVQYIRLRLKAHGITKRWSTLRTELESWMRVTTELSEQSGAITTTRQDTELSDKLNHIAEILDINPASHHVQTRAKPGLTRQT